MSFVLKICLVRVRCCPTSHIWISLEPIPTKPKSMRVWHGNSLGCTWYRSIQKDRSDAKNLQHNATTASVNVEQVILGRRGISFWGVLKLQETNEIALATISQLLQSKKQILQRWETCVCREVPHKKRKSTCTHKSCSGEGPPLFCEQVLHTCKESPNHKE